MAAVADVLEAHGPAVFQLPRAGAADDALFGYNRHHAMMTIY